MTEEQAKETVKKKRGSSLYWIIGAILICLFLFVYFVTTPCLLNAKRSAFEVRAKDKLRELVGMQVDFQNNNSAYATWDELIESGYIDKRDMQGNFIVNYSLWTSVQENEFAIIAFPRKTTPPGYLGTFAIRDDQVLRRYYPGPGATEWDENEDCVLTWEPIR